MGDFDDAYEMGLVDSEGTATGVGWNDDYKMQKRPNYNKDTQECYNYDNKIQKFYKETSDSTYRYIKVILTPASLLNSEEKYARKELYEEYEDEIVLELIHDRGNEYDRKALEVYYEHIYIGHIRKKFKDSDIDNTRIINDFCFENNRLKDVDIVWDGNNFILSQKTEQGLKEEYEQEKKHKAQKIARDKERQLKKERERQKRELQREQTREDFKQTVWEVKDFIKRAILFVIAWSAIIGTIYFLIKLI